MNPTALESLTATEPELDIESIKQLMDAFDPASLLPSLQGIFGSLATMCRWAVIIAPIVMLALGLSYLFFSPREANYYFGFRCYFGMGSVRAWRFTQRLAGFLLSFAGLILTLVMVILSSGFASMDVNDMVWKAVDCLVWQVGIAFAIIVSIHVTAAVRFDRKGELRRNHRSASRKRPKQ